MFSINDPYNHCNLFYCSRRSMKELKNNIKTVLTGFSNKPHVESSDLLPIEVIFNNALGQTKAISKETQ